MSTVPCQQLWGACSETPGRSGIHRKVCNLPPDPKVEENIPSIFVRDIVRLYIAVDETQIVQIVNRRGKIVKQISRLDSTTRAPLVVENYGKAALSEERLSGAIL